MTSFIKPYLPLIIPILAVPLAMKFIIAPLICRKLRKSFFKNLSFLSEYDDLTQKDIEALNYLEESSKKGLHTPFVISYNYTFLRSQIINMFYNISAIYGNNDITNYEFSIQKVIEAMYLLFEDLHKNFKLLKIFKFLEKLPLNVFLRVNNINKFVKLLTRHKVFRVFQKYRITGKFLRIIFIPIIGLPIIISQLFFSLIYSTLLEGYMRFIYGLIVMKIGYYTVYLYSDRNNSLHKNIKFCHQKIITKGEMIEQRHKNFREKAVTSEKLSEALESLKTELESMGVLPNRECNPDTGTLERTFSRIKNSLKNAVKSEFSETYTANLKIDDLLSITKKVGSSYFPGSKNPILQMRAKEFIELGYFATNVILKSIYTVPGLKQTLDKVPLKVIININKYLEENKLKKYIPHLKKGKKAISNARTYYLATKVLLRRSNPITFAVSFVSPMIIQQTQDMFKEYVYNTYGLLLIDSFEASHLKSKSCRIEELSY